jgi:hypothetical protein
MSVVRVREGLGLVRLILVWSSLSPVFILWAIRGVETVPDYVWVPICLTLFALPSAILYAIFKRSKKSKNEKTITVESARDQREHLLTYLFAMLIPLFDANLSGYRDLAAISLAFIFVVFLFWHMKLHYMNLVFAIAGYKIFTVETRVGTTTQDRDRNRLVTYAVISKKDHISENDQVTGYRLGGNVLFDEREE